MHSRVQKAFFIPSWRGCHYRIKLVRTLLHTMTNTHRVLPFHLSEKKNRKTHTPGLAGNLRKEGNQLNCWLVFRTGSDGHERGS